MPGVEAPEAGVPSKSSAALPPEVVPPARSHAITRIKSYKALVRGIAPKLDAEEVEEWAQGHPEDVDYLVKLPWVQEVLATPGMQTLLTCGAMSKPHELDQDHLFLSMLREDLIRDIMFLWSPQQREFHTLIALGPDVCGHRGIVHGGFTSAVLDETTGGLVYELKKLGMLGEGPAFTARLEVDYKRPLPAGTDIICTARMSSLEGRKIWTDAELRDRSDGNVFASGRALYVTPRQYATAAGADGGQQPADQPAA